MSLKLASYGFITEEGWRILYAVERGLRSFEFVPRKRIDEMSGLRQTNELLQELLRFRLLGYEKTRSYPGYRLTNLGFDYLALRSFFKLKVLSAVGDRIGVGKEADVHLAWVGKQRLALKVYRLGRTSFRSAKANRHFLNKKQQLKGSLWLDLSSRSALQEFKVLKTLYNAGLPVPKPVDQNRHCLLMTFQEGSLLNHINKHPNPLELLIRLLDVLVEMARKGIVHGDFNEFNLIVDPVNPNKISLIDFPQVISVLHPQAEEYFERDQTCVRTFFLKRFNVTVAEPLVKLSEIVGSVDEEEIEKAKDIFDPVIVQHFLAKADSSGESTSDDSDPASDDSDPASDDSDPASDDSDPASDDSDPDASDDSDPDASSASEPDRASESESASESAIQDKLGQSAHGGKSHGLEVSSQPSVGVASKQTDI